MSRSSASSSVKRIYWGAGIMLAILLASMAMAFARFADLESANNANTQLHRVLLATGEATRSLVDMETGNRGFLLTGEEKFRAPFYQGRDTFSARYKELRASTAQQPDQQKRLIAIKEKLTRWFALYNPIIQRRRGGRLDVQSMGNVDARRALINEMRALLNEVRVVEENILQDSAARQSALQTITKSTLALNALLGSFFVGLLAWGLGHSARRVELTNEGLRREIEHRKRVERERQILASHNEQILNSTGEGIISLNARGRITFANPAASVMSGWEVSELLGKPFHEFLHHSRADNTRVEKENSVISRSLRDGEARRVVDEVFWGRRGTSFPVEYSVTPLWENDTPDENEDAETVADEKTAAAQLVGATVTFRDITDRKRSEIALIRLASIVESSKDAILSHLLDGSIVSCNAAAVRMYGHSARELEGQSLSILLPPSRIEEAALVVQCIARGERIEPYQTTVVKRDGTRIDVAITFYPVKDAAGKIVGASSNARPIRRASGPPTALPTSPVSVQSESSAEPMNNGFELNQASVQSLKVPQNG